MELSAQLPYDLIRAQGEKDPDAPAILEPGKETMSYRQLIEQVDAAALQLNRLGFRRGDRIALVLPNGAYMVTAYLAISYVCTCAAINPAYKLEEYNFYLADLRINAVMMMRGVDHPARQAAAAFMIPVLDLEPDPLQAGLFSLFSERPLDMRISKPIPADINDVAHLLYTSGTSTRPKLVPVTYRNLIFACALENVPVSSRLLPTDRCLGLNPMFHLQGVGLAANSLLAGASFICAPGFIPNKVMDWFADLAPTWFGSVPALLEAILNLAQLQPDTLKRVHLRFITSGSAPLSPELARRMESVFGAPVLDSYGMTETSWAIAQNLLPPFIRKAGSVGKPAGPSRVCIMDESGNILPANLPGEICTCGENVFSGYENDPEGNASAFINGWLRTGDFGYIDEDGYVFIKGRIKEIINRGGEKIAPQEVDDVLARHPAVKQAAAFGVPHPTLGEDVAATVVLQAGQAVTAWELRQFAAASLANFKVPRQVIFVEEIPMTASRKVKRVGMSERFKTDLEALHELAAADVSRELTGTELSLQRIWQEALGLPQVGIGDDFFDIGGNSLTAAQVVAHIQDEFGIALPITKVFEFPRIVDLAGQVNGALQQEEQPAGQDGSASDRDVLII